MHETDSDLGNGLAGVTNTRFLLTNDGCGISLKSLIVGFYSFWLICFLGDSTWLFTDRNFIP